MLSGSKTGAIWGDGTYVVRDAKPEPSPRQAAALQALVQTDIIVGYLASTCYEQKRFEEQLNGRQKQAFFQAVFRHRQKLNPHNFELERAH